MTTKWRAALAGAVTVIFLGTAGIRASEQSGSYVGSEACGECHQEQFESFSKYSKKSHTQRGVLKMFSDLEEQEKKECYECHTTGYGRGGFVSYETTPQFADVGCETCHGPGGDHAEYGGDTEYITRRPLVESCEKCHNAARVKDFNYKPLLYSGAH